eukprot:bmy_13024T0
MEAEDTIDVFQQQTGEKCLFVLKVDLTSSSPIFYMIWAINVVRRVTRWVQLKRKTTENCDITTILLKKRKNVGTVYLSIPSNSSTTMTPFPSIILKKVNNHLNIKKSLPLFISCTYIMFSYKHKTLIISSTFLKSLKTQQVGHIPVHEKTNI